MCARLPRCLLLALGVLIALLSARAAEAHPFSVSGFRVDVEPDRLTVTWDLDVKTMVDLLGELDSDGDRKLSDAESEAARHRLIEHVDRKLTITSDGKPCEAGAVEKWEPAPKQKMRLVRVYRCTGEPGTLRFTNDVFMDDRGGHTHVGEFHVGKGLHRHTFVRENTVFELDARAPAPEAAPAPAPKQKTRPAGTGALFTGFLWQGIWHILIGIDHILFVLALVVAVRTFRELAIVVTSFTLAHSITLALGALELVTINARLVESLIALSIVYVGVENIWREQPKKRQWVTFGFGLMHGFGFSSVLRDYGLPTEGLTTALFAFNIGVELGQLAIVAPLFPLLMLLRKRSDTFRKVAVGISGAVAAVATGWFIERALGLEIMPF